MLLTDAALSSASAQIAFQDVSAAAGFANTAPRPGARPGATWTVTIIPICSPATTARARRLFHNNQNGTFTEVSKQVDLSKTPGWTGGRSDVDTHGAMWGDVNNDGQEDLIEAVSSSADHLWINNGGKLTLSTIAYGVDKLPARSKRQILFFDYNGDGRLDLASIGLRSLELVAAVVE